VLFFGQTDVAGPAGANLSTKCSGLLLRSSLAIWAARRRHPFSAASNPGFSVASRPSNSSDITRAPTSQRRPSARWSPVERTRFKVVLANSTWRVTGSSCRIAPVHRADCVCFVTADEGAAARPRRRGDRMMGWMTPVRHRRAKLVFRRITRNGSHPWARLR